jgi:hypothetical protein
MATQSVGEWDPASGWEKESRSAQVKASWWARAKVSPSVRAKG